MNAGRSCPRLGVARAAAEPAGSSSAIDIARAARRPGGRRCRSAGRLRNTAPASRPPIAVADHVLHVGDAEAVARDCRLVERRSPAPAGRSICSTLTSAAPATPRRMPAIWLAACSSGSNSSPKTLTATSPRTPAMQLVEAHLDRLREFVGVAGQRLDRRLDLAQPALPCVKRGSGHSSRGFSMMNVSETLGGIGSVADFGRAGLREDERDLREGALIAFSTASCIAVRLR